MAEKKYCLFCKKELSTSKYSTESMRTDGYCTAKCKRKDKGRQYKEELKRRKCDPDHGWF